MFEKQYAPLNIHTGWFLDTSYIRLGPKLICNFLCIAIAISGYDPFDEYHAA